MWHRVKNLFISLNSYAVLSPDLKVRQQVNKALRDRPELSAEDWFHRFYQAYGVAHPVVIFAYSQLQHYSGLQFGRVLPTDRFHEDLRWSDVCWFDWNLQLYDDCWQEFGVDLRGCFDELQWITVQDFVVGLNQAIYQTIPARSHLEMEI
ncbi:hypothetical protein [Thermocoleostomius sinensis]|uniref:Uncharacterized protein n=1 Tax=Thermocoleostomius sinensis A174 TaxID=2016057 RepID=A0A9E9C807_9CYAN|nr:hypothetical protein [Thermocoleostomius sinensis]WAL60919.1 hypothetical protein OXH18_02660 [Thermocoleostomius sinensis A174]